MLRILPMLIIGVAVFAAFFATRTAPMDRAAWLIGAVVVAFVFILLRGRRANADALEGIAMLNQGRFSEALAAFQRGLARFPQSNALVFNTGVALVSMWRVAEADAAFAKAAGMKLARLTFDVTSMLEPQRALVAALLGRAEDAKAHLRACEALTLGRSAHVLLAQAILAVRAGDFAEGRRQLSVYEVRLLGGPTRGLADALAAWCVEQMTGERRHVDRLGLFGEAGPDAIRRFWPELADFIERAPSA
jgi:tetratricopeptide (TPR) repeat protein